MADDVEIKGINLKVKASGTDTAAKGLDKVTAALNNLKSASGTGTSGEIGQQIGQLGEAVNGLNLDKLARLRSVLSGVSSASKSIDSLVQGLERIQTIDFSNLEGAREALQAIASISNARSNAKQTTSTPAAPVTQPVSTGGTTNVSGTRQAAEEMKNLAAATKKAAPAADKASDSYSNLQGILGDLRSAASSVGKAGLRGLARPFREAGANATALAKKLGQLGAAFKRIIFYRVIRSIIKAIGDAFKQGVNNVYQWSKAVGNGFAGTMDRAATSLQYFKNSIGAAVAPLLNALVPVLEYVIDKVVALLNLLNQLFARLAGQSVWIKAVKQPKEYADAVGGAAGSAGKAYEKLKDYMLGIDELNVFNDDKANSGGGGGGGGGGVDYSDMFEEVPIEDFKGKLGDIFKVFKDAWANEGQPTMDAIHHAFDSLKELGTSVGNSIHEVFTNGTGQTTIETILRIAQNLLNTVGNLAGRIKEAWDENNRGTAIIQNIWNILNSILGTYEKITASISKWSSEVDFGPLLESINNLTAAFNPLVELLGGILTDVWNEVLLPLASWTIEKSGPDSINLFASAIRILTGVLGPVWEMIKALWQALQPLVQVLLELGSTVMQSVTEGFSSFAQMLQEKGPEISQILSALGQSIGLLMQILAPVVQMITDTLGPALTWLFKQLSLDIGLIVDVVSGLVQIIASLTNGDLEGAVEGVKRIVGGLADYVVGSEENMKQNMVTTLTNLWVSVKDRWNRIGQDTKTKSGEIRTNLANSWNLIKNDAIEGWKKIGEKIAEKFGGVKQKLEEKWRSLKQWWAGLSLPEFKLKMPHIEWTTKPAPEWIGSILKALGLPDSIPSMSVKWYAEGGLPDIGELFVARERGPEMVGTIGNRTAVANNDQIVEAVARGVSNSNAPVVSAIYDIADRVIAAIDRSEKPVVIGDRDIHKAAKRGAEKSGTSGTKGAFEFAR